jgi:S-adenosylmethionine/arginine decarboxylase-like enzyme
MLKNIMFKPNHLHLLVKGYCKNPPREVDFLNKWFVELVEKVRMVVVAGPTSVYVSEEGNEGLTGTVTLATSHSSIHVWEKYEPPMFQFDLYSCTCFSVDEVIEHLNKFDLISYEYIMIDRNGEKMTIIGNDSK